MQSTSATSSSPAVVQHRGLEASSTASGGALGCLPARLLLPRPPGRDHSSSAAVLVRVVFSLSSLLACWPAGLPQRPTARAASQQQPATASINQHHPSWSTLTAALARCCTSNHNLQATGHGTWPSPIAPSPILPNRSRAPRTVDERPSNRGREPAKAGWETEGTRAQGHNTNRSIVGRPVPLWSWTRYCLMNREAGVVLLSRPRPPERGAGTESSNHRIIEQLNNRHIRSSASSPGTTLPSSLCRAALSAVERTPLGPGQILPTEASNDGAHLSPLSPRLCPHSLHTSFSH
jgi:hypothetical protein